jgi:hypothetical protein
VLLDRLGRHVSLERGLLAGGLLVLAGSVILAWIFVPWAAKGFGELSHEYPTALAFTLVGLGVQVVFGSFFVGILTLRTTDDRGPRGAVVATGAARERVGAGR